LKDGRYDVQKASIEEQAKRLLKNEGPMSPQEIKRRLRTTNVIFSVLQGTGFEFRDGKYAVRSIGPGGGMLGPPRRVARRAGTSLR